MHWVDRGPEPGGLEEIRERYTPRWIQFYKNEVGTKPTDSRWRDFHDELQRRFGSLCGYCESSCKGEVDHFRPKSRFPESVYEWSNWIFVCRDCNQAKGDKWPVGGYVNPCSVSESSRPETYFTFDTKTGEIVPIAELDDSRFYKAQGMIDDLRLNGRHHLEKRVALLYVMTETIPDDPREETSVSGRLRRFWTSHTSELSSIARAWLAERGYSISG